VPDELKKERLYEIMKMIFKTEAEKYLGIKDIKYKGDKDPKEVIKEKLDEKKASEAKK
jgi:hypothetical protein